MLATEYAEFYGISPQVENENDHAFRSRVAGALRDEGHIIEAHEVQQGARYEDSDDVTTGIIGAVAQALQGVDYGSTGEQQVGDDIAAGVVIQTPKVGMSPEEALLAMLLFG